MVETVARAGAARRITVATTAINGGTPRAAVRGCKEARLEWYRHPARDSHGEVRTREKARRISGPLSAPDWETEEIRGVVAVVEGGTCRAGRAAGAGREAEYSMTKTSISNKCPHARRQRRAV